MNRQLDWIVILVINIIAIAQIAFPIQSYQSGAGFYAGEVAKTPGVKHGGWCYGKYHISSLIQDFVFSTRKKGCIRCISLQVYNKLIYYMSPRCVENRVLSAKSGKLNCTQVFVARKCMCHSLFTFISNIYVILF